MHPFAAKASHLRASIGMYLVIRMEETCTHKEEPIPPFEHPVTRTIVLFVDMLTIVGCVRRVPHTSRVLYLGAQNMRQSYDLSVRVKRPPQIKTIPRRGTFSCLKTDGLHGCRGRWELQVQFYIAGKMGRRPRSAVPENLLENPRSFA